MKTWVSVAFLVVGALLALAGGASLILDNEGWRWILWGALLLALGTVYLQASRRAGKKS